MPELVFITACKHISLKFFFVCVCGTNRKIHIAKKEENNLRTTTKGIIFVELLSCAQLLRSCIILLRTLAGWQLLPWTASIAWEVFVSSQLQYGRSWSPYYNCLLRSCYTVKLHRHKMVSDQMCTHRFWTRNRIEIHIWDRVPCSSRLCHICLRFANMSDFAICLKFDCLRACGELIL